jgi:NADPH2:quinone reductase
MRAAVPACGPPEVVRVEERPSLTVAPGHVRLKVGAAGELPDGLLIANEYQISVPPPFVPGSEFAGVIVRPATAQTVSRSVTRSPAPGSTVPSPKRSAWCPRPGLRVPDGVDERTAAAFGVAYRTYHSLRSMARVHDGDELIVLGAGGGVGLAAVQLGVQLGASVTAVASSTEKLDVAAGYGATHLINYKTGDLRGALKVAPPGGADAVVDPVGGELSEPALRSLGRGGRFVTIGFASGVIPRIPLNLVLVKGVHVLGFQFQDVSPDEFACNEGELREHLVTGRVHPHVGAVHSPQPWQH